MSPIYNDEHKLKKLLNKSLKIVIGSRNSAWLLKYSQRYTIYSNNTKISTIRL